LVTINDIAKKAGVSPATVSRILNNKNKYSSSKSLKVLEIARELGYSVKAHNR
jgi:LacI family transcriptional regulator